jgi:hypothetical protein
VFRSLGPLAVTAVRSAIGHTLLISSLVASGCDRGGTQPAAPPDAAVGTPPARSAAADAVAADGSAAESAAAAFAASAESLLNARLPLAETDQGWVRLFDGVTLFGWQVGAPANWRVEEGAIRVDQGPVGLLCTSVPWRDFELRLEILADEATNSGVFLRTPLSPTDPQSDCYEVNIAPADNPFPTGSVVKRQPATTKPNTKPGEWNLYEMRLVGDSLTIRINGEEVCHYTDPAPLGPGRIGLQHNSGAVAFRDIRVRPIGMKELITPDLAQWKQYPAMDGKFQITEEGLLRVTGGRGQLESKELHGDFALLARVKTASEKLNSGIFFRCIPGETMNGYECQISNGILDNDPLRPADCGSGGIFRRQDARIVAANDGEWFSMLLVAHGPQFAAWVNGLQVTDWRDTRVPNPNPRSGSRLEPGTLMIQAHDPTTDLVFRQIEVAELAPAKDD